MQLNVLNRFSDRVENYIKYRPGYPEAVFRFFREELGLKPHHRIADLGSGTGIFTKQLLEGGNTVYAVEPNTEMRNAAEKTLCGNPRFISITATAEATNLPDRSVDFVTAAQAFHWFDPLKARLECQRILKSDQPERSRANAALIWNDRNTSSSDFLIAYEKALETFGVDYKEVRRLGDEHQSTLEAFFGGKTYQTFRCPNQQLFDYAGLLGRTLSSSYMPQQGHPQHEPMLGELERIFDRYNKDGIVRFDYETQVFYGVL